MPKTSSYTKPLSDRQREDLISMLQKRFEKHASCHKGITWAHVEARLEKHPEKLWSLSEMEATGGEPDIIEYDKKADKYVFCDCSTESPTGRRSLCYDRKALDARREHKPKGSAIDMATTMGIELLTEQQYRFLQQSGEYDRKTSSWVKTPENIRTLGGSLFCDRRYDKVFTYHNGADSYYATRGFRGMLRI